MTFSEAFVFAVILLVGMPSAFRIGIRGGLRVSIRNATSVGLIASFIVMKAIWFLSKQAPLEVYILCDFIVLTAIFLKGVWLDEISDGGIFTRAWAAWLELSRADKIVAGLFLPCWLTYAANFSATEKYWILWFIGVTQLLLSGAESFGTWRRGRASASSEAHPADWFLRQRYAGHGW